MSGAEYKPPSLAWVLEHWLEPGISQGHAFTPADVEEAVRALVREEIERAVELKETLIVTSVDALKASQAVEASARKVMEALQGTRACSSYESELGQNGSCRHCKWAESWHQNVAIVKGQGDVREGKPPIPCAEPGCSNICGGWLPLGWQAFCRIHQGERTGGRLSAEEMAAIAKDGG